MVVDYKKFTPIGIKILVVTFAALFLYFIGIPILKLLLPFIIAGIIALLIEPQVRFFQQNFKMSRKLSSFVSLIIFLLVFGTIIFFIIYKIVIELVTLSYNAPKYFKSLDLNNEMQYWANLSQKFYLSIPPEAANLIQNRLNEAIDTMSGHVSNFISSTLSFVLDFIRLLPESFVFIIITIISTYFISSDKNKIRDFIFKQFPESWAPKIRGLKSDLIFAFIGFLKAQLILIMVSILIASIGLTILKVKYSLTIGTMIGIAELIPVVGTGLIFVPWIIFELLSKNIYLAIGLFAVFILGVIVRHLIEPKIIGVQIGIYPLVALISIYIGLHIFGVFGMILGPIIVIILKNLNKSGVIHLWKE